MAKAQLTLTLGRFSISQSTHRRTREALHLRDQSRELEELAHPETTAFAASPQLGEPELRTQLELGSPVSEQDSAGLGPILGVVGPDALGPITGSLLVRDEAAPELFGVGIDLEVRVRCAVIPYLVKLLHGSPHRALRARRRAAFLQQNRRGRCRAEAKIQVRRLPAPSLSEEQRSCTIPGHQVGPCRRVSRRRGGADAAPTLLSQAVVAHGELDDEDEHRLPHRTTRHDDAGRAEWS